jgi:hypothetical protein
MVIGVRDAKQHLNSNELYYTVQQRVLLRALPSSLARNASSFGPVW